MSEPRAQPGEVALAVGAAVLDEVTTPDTTVKDVKPGDLKRKTARGAVVSTGAQIVMLVLRTSSMMIMARLLVPEDFGLFGMVAAFTGFLGLFKDAGLSLATVQRESITNAQTSTLFWINLAVGGVLTLLCFGVAPVLVAFYKEPRLFWMTVAVGAGFLLNGAGWQHRAMLQRSMRFGTLAIIDILSLLLSVGMAIGMAVAGLKYWALVVMTVGLYGVHTVAVWLVAGWIPARPSRGSGVRSMLAYGGAVTINNLIVYLAYNADKMLLGKFMGAEVLGVYSRAYQLSNLPTENLNSTIGSVAFPALSRVQNDPPRLRSYFLKGYSLFLALVVPITMSCALFSEDIIRFFLGPKWGGAAGVFRLMAPTILIFAMINPFAWLMLAGGKAGRSLKIALMIAPVVIVSYAIGLKWGANGVAGGFSLAMLVLALPVIFWAKLGTLITASDVFKAVMTPVSSVLMGALAAWACGPWLRGVEPVFVRLVAECAILFGVYLAALLFIFKQKAVYTEVLHQMGVWPLSKRGKKENAG